MQDLMTAVIQRHGADRTRLIDMLWDVQDAYGYIPEPATRALAEDLNLSPLDVQETASFYHFFHQKPTGRHHIYLSNSVIAKMNGFQAVYDALERETGCVFEEQGGNPLFSLFETSCIGLNDQEPAMLIDRVPFTRLNAAKVNYIIGQLKQGRSPAEIANPDGIPETELAYVEAIVESNVRSKGPVFFRGKLNLSQVINEVLNQHPEQVISAITEAGLRGRGGAGFPTGLKWRLCRGATGDEKYIICNADEGEPGTFKDRVLLTRSPKQVFMGMVLAAYAIGSSKGIIYLRAEYWYLKSYLEEQLRQMREKRMLGLAISGNPGFNFDIRIQMGAGAYICGDESALIESCEGKRGTPRLKPPFPVHSGFLGKPTSVNNVETFAAATHIMEQGPDWFKFLGTKDSRGSRLLSVSGDCRNPGIYEVAYGTTIKDVLERAGASRAMAVQVSGPSGECLSVEKDSSRRIAYEDVACNGSFMIFDQGRDLLDVVREFMHFFADESCGICVPCRTGTIVLHDKLKLVQSGCGSKDDIADMIAWSKIVRSTSRCGLGTTAPKAILTTLENFPQIYESKLVVQKGALLPSFDRDEALRDHFLAVRELERESAKTAVEPPTLQTVSTS